MNKVAIIGAGASGLISAKVLLDNGFDVKVLKKLIMLQESGIIVNKRVFYTKASELICPRR